MRPKHDQLRKGGGGNRPWQSVRRPEVITDLVQILKCVIAASAAWWFAVAVLHSEMPFLAPWTALLTVHVTIFRSFSRGLQTLVASGLGVLVSFVIGSFLGVSPWTFALALLVGMLGSRLGWIRDEGVAIATTAIFVLGSGFGEQQPLLGDRMLEVAVGVVFGVVVNVVLIPPLRDRQAAGHVDSINRQMGQLLTEMGEAFSSSWDVSRADSWIQATADMGDELRRTWRTVRFARESGWGNPRRHLPGPQGTRPGGPPRQWTGGGGSSASAEDAGEASYEEILQRVEEGISHLRHLARSLREAEYVEGEWDTRFREEWSRVVHDAGHAIADPDAEVEPVHDRLAALAVRMSEQEGLPRAAWPVYGSLIAGMEHIALVVDDVASARKARESGRREG